MTLLTADDVLNKKFQATKFREGYEQDEVDEFLDEVVEAMRQLEAENADLKAKLEAANRRVAELGDTAARGISYTLLTSSSLVLSSNKFIKNVLSIDTFLKLIFSRDISIAFLPSLNFTSFCSKLVFNLVKLL